MYRKDTSAYKNSQCTTVSGSAIIAAYTVCRGGFSRIVHRQDTNLVRDTDGLHGRGKSLGKRGQTRKRRRNHRRRQPGRTPGDMEGEIRRFQRQRNTAPRKERAKNEIENENLETSGRALENSAFPLDGGYGMGLSATSGRKLVSSTGPTTARKRGEKESEKK